MKTVTAWSVNLVWSDGTEEVVTNVPSYVAQEVDDWLTHLEAQEVDDWLTHLEEEVNADEPTEEGEE